MRRRNQMIVAGTVAVAAVLASHLDLPHRSRAATPPEAVIVRLEARNQQITVTSSPAGPRYSIALDGHLVADRLTLDELRVQYPDAYEQIYDSTAAAAPSAWAGLDGGE